MCNLYSIKTRRIDLARKFGLSDNRMAAFDTLAAIFPGHVAPIIKQSDDGARELVLRSWGFVLLRDGYAPKRVTNTRDDKVHTKFWKDSFEKRRCLVPATAFCEPDEGKPARWHWFALKARRAAPALRFPRHLSAVERPDQEGWPERRYRDVLISDDAAQRLDRDHQPRAQPGAADRGRRVSTWLTGTPEEAFGLIKASDPASMEIVQSGLEKKDLLAAA